MTETPSTVGVHTSEPRTVLARIAAAQQRLARVKWEKTKFVSLGGSSGYWIIPISQILDNVRAAHAAEGIVTLFGAPEYDAANGEYRRTASDGRSVIAVGHIDVRILGPDGDCVEVTVPCEARDSADKCNNKLVTNAMRSLYRTMYSIDADDTPDPEETNGAKAEEYTPNPEARAQARAQAQADPFFGKAEDKPKTAKAKAKSKQATVEEAPASPQDASTAIGSMTDGELAQRIGVLAASPEYRDFVAGFLADFGASSASDLDRDLRVALLASLVSKGAQL